MGGERPGHGEPIVDQQSTGRGEARQVAEVLAGDDVAATAPGVGADGLAVREGHHHQEHGDAAADWQGQPEGGAAAEDQDRQDGLGGVGHRGERVGREHGEGGDSAQPLVVLVLCGNWLADEQAFERRGHNDPLHPLGARRGRHSAHLKLTRVVCWPLPRARRRKKNADSAVGVLCRLS